VFNKVFNQEVLKHHLKKHKELKEMSKNLLTQVSILLKMHKTQGKSNKRKKKKTLMLTMKVRFRNKKFCDVHKNSLSQM
jgi:hypothetical protein